MAFHAIVPNHKYTNRILFSLPLHLIVCGLYFYLALSIGVAGIPMDIIGLLYLIALINNLSLLPLEIIIGDNVIQTKTVFGKRTVQLNEKTLTQQTLGWPLFYPFTRWRNKWSLGEVRTPKAGKVWLILNSLSETDKDLIRKLIADSRGSDGKPVRFGW